MRLFEERVTLEPIRHEYTHRDGRIFESLSRVRACVKEKFNEKQHILSAGKGKYIGMTPDQVKAQWNEWSSSSQTVGNTIHEALERYEKTALILPEDEHLRPMIMSLTSQYKDMYQVHQEVTMYDEEYEIAGTADHIIETTSSKRGIINIDDYKTNERNGIYYESKLKKYLLGPFSHIQDTNYFDYSMQLSCYAYMINKLTGRKIGTLSIVFIPPSNPLAWRIIPVSYMKYEAIELFKFYKEYKHIQKEEGDTGVENQFTPNFSE